MRIKPKNQQDVWDTIAESFSHTRKSPWQIVLDFIQIQPKPDLSIDLGCGNGRHSIPLALHSKQSLAVDFSKNLLQITKKQLISKHITNTSLIQANLTSLPLKDNSVDMALMIASLHSIPHKTKRQSTLKELYRILKPQSTALLTVWNTNHKAYQTNPNSQPSQDAIIYWRQHSHNEPRYYHLYTKDELIEDIKTSNLRIKTIEEKTLSKTTQNDNIIAVLSKD